MGLTLKCPACNISPDASYSYGRDKDLEELIKACLYMAQAKKICEELEFSTLWFNRDNTCEFAAEHIECSGFLFIVKTDTNEVIKTVYSEIPDGHKIVSAISNKLVEHVDRLHNTIKLSVKKYCPCRSLGSPICICNE
jgi:hypothetical protein